MHLHRRQFVVGPRQWLANTHWKACPLQKGGCLSYCSDLTVIEAKDLDGVSWFLIGLVIEAHPKRQTPEKTISRSRTFAVPQMTSHWAGRWILIGNGEIYLDASGLLGCFYTRTSNGDVWTSSSIALLAQYGFLSKEPTPDRRKLVYEVGISWYTPPLSGYAGIARLLPSQVLKLQSGQVEARPLMPDIVLGRDYDMVLKQIQQGLETVLERLTALSTDLWLGMTAGYDSRLMLALSHKVGIPVRPFTRITARMSIADRIFPPKLSAECGYSHVFMRASKRYPDRQGLAMAQTGGHVSAGDAEPFVKGIRDHMQGISFGGHGFSVSSGFYKLPELPSHITSIAEGIKYLSRVFQEPVHSSAMQGIHAWLSWVFDHSQEHLNWRDRFFIEQRQAGWLSSKEQLYDLNDLQRFPILNSAYLFSLLLSIEEEKRIGSKIQRELINRVNPQLSQYPYNPDDLYFGAWKVLRTKGSALPQSLFIKMGRRVQGIWKFLFQG